MPSIPRNRSSQLLVPCFAAFSLFVIAADSHAAPWVEFDFARVVECRGPAKPEQTAGEACERTIGMKLPVSVRFRGGPAEDIEEINIEIIGNSAEMRVASFSPMTRLASDLTEPVKTTTITRNASSLDGSLGGTLPIPYAELVAHLTPTINAGLTRSKSATESISRLPPQRAIVVSGTSAEGRGVFFKFKPSTQTSLEGVHELTVIFVVPKDWKAGAVRVVCHARGQRKFMFVKQPATLGHEANDVTLRARTVSESPKVQAE